MNTEPENTDQDEPSVPEREPFAHGPRGMGENLLLVSGVGLVLLAVAMALSNILA